MRLNLAKLKSMGIDNIKHWSVPPTPLIVHVLYFMCMQSAACSGDSQVEDLPGVTGAQRIGGRKSALIHLTLYCVT